MRRHPQFFAYLALVSVCVFWGTTYLGIRMALESIPPWTLVSLRYLLSGTVMLIAAWWRGVTLPKGRELLRTALNGIVVLGGGNGSLVFAETLVPSGLAALFITTSPFWMVGSEAAVPGGERLHAPTVAGMLIGFTGTALLVAPDLSASGLHGNVVRAFLLLQFGCLTWSLGSILQRRMQTRAHPVISGAVQQLATGLAFVLPALLLDQEPVRWTWKGTAALLYLVFFGSIVGYSAYIYAMDRLPVALVSIYTYINPIVAVLLGWAVYREPFGWREAAAMLVIFGGVAVVKKTSHRAPSAVGARGAEES